MPKTTPFYPRTEPLNLTKIWSDWAGYLAAPRYQYSELSEYYAIRNSAALLDTSPLFKYRFTGTGAQPLLEKALARNIHTCKVGQAQYTCWCNEAGFVLEDGVVLHIADHGTDGHEYWMTSAEPNLRYFKKLARDLDITNCQIEDISNQYGILALQGPHSLNILQQLTEDVAALRYFDLAQTTVAGRPVVVSRTGFTGDLGYELWIQATDALLIWDALMEAGAGYNITPMGLDALKMARIEAGLLLLDVDFHSARFAWVDAQRDTPIELGWSWMFRKLATDERDFIGRSAIEAEIANKSSRWVTVGLEIDWAEFDRIHREAGIMTPKDGLRHEGTMSLYRRSDKEWDYAGYATCFLYSSLLKKHIAIAKLPRDLAEPGGEVDLEISVIRRPMNVLARVTKMPFYNPKRKTAKA
ncbi:MAG: aminomethyltransferase family protein [Chloroflexota bacterium]